MSLDDAHESQISAQLRQISLCAAVIEELFETLRDPATPDSRADLLLATERLARDVALLLDQTRAIAWQEAPKILPNSFL